MAKRIMITLSDELYEWLVKNSEENVIPLATYATMLINQSRKAVEVQNDMHKTLKSMSADQLYRLLDGNIKKVEQIKEPDKIDDTKIIE